MNETIECPSCGHSMHYTITDETGSYYECPNCDYEFCDDSQKADDSEE